MTKLFEEAGKSFLRAFGATFLVLATGILAAPNLNQAVAIAGAASIASVVAGLKVLQQFVPALYVGQYVSEKYAALVDSAVRAFVGTYIATAVGVLASPDLGTSWKQLGVSAIVAALTAAVRAVQGAFTNGSTVTKFGFAKA